MARLGSTCDQALLSTKKGREKLRSFSISLNPELVATLEARGFTVEDLIRDFLEFLKNQEVKNG